MPQESRTVDVVMLGLPEFRVLEARDIDGEIELLIETTPKVMGCSGCGVRARSKGRGETVVRDVAAFDRPVRLRWRKRRWRCPEPLCPVSTWTETSAAIAPRAVLTDRARCAAARRVGRDADSVAEVARDYGTGWHTVNRAVWDCGQPLVETRVQPHARVGRKPLRAIAPCLNRPSPLDGETLR